MIAKAPMTSTYPYSHASASACDIRWALCWFLPPVAHTERAMSVPYHHLRKFLEQFLELSLIHHADAQFCIISPPHIRSVLWAENAHCLLHYRGDSAVRVCFECLICLLRHFCSAGWLDGTLRARCDLFAKLKQLILGRDNILHLEGAVFGSVAHFKDSDNSCASGGHHCSAKALVSGVEQGYGPLFHVDQDTTGQAEVQQRSCPDARV